MFLRNQSRLYDTGRMSVGTQWHPVGASASHWLARVHCDKNDRDRVIPRWSTNYWTVKTRQRTGDSCTRWPACETLTLASGSSNSLTARLAFAIDFLRFQVLDHGAMSGITSSKAVWPEDTWPLRPVIRSLINCWVTRDRFNRWFSDETAMEISGYNEAQSSFFESLWSFDLQQCAMYFSSYRWTEWISHQLLRRAPSSGGIHCVSVPLGNKRKPRRLRYVGIMLLWRQCELY